MSLTLKMVPVWEEAQVPPLMLFVHAVGPEGSPRRFRAELHEEGRSFTVEWHGDHPEELVGKAVLHARKYNPLAKVETYLDPESERCAVF